jgi:hypothetical protein
MSQVFIRRRPGRVPDIAIEKLVEAMPAIVANALNVPERVEGRLTPEEIEITVVDHGKFDTHTLDLEITIFANDYPERRENLESRNLMIINDLKSAQVVKDYYLALDKQAFVWVLLMPGSFSVF